MYSISLDLPRLLLHLADDCVCVANVSFFLSVFLFMCLHPIFHHYHYHYHHRKLLSFFCFSFRKNRNANLFYICFRNLRKLLLGRDIIEKIIDFLSLTEQWLHFIFLFFLFLCLSLSKLEKLFLIRYLNC